ncbi:Hsp70 family protein [Estrella lausannensis]|uniref:Chaperone protein DnaK n=1 Tax=Estrella lausannensis TaxID=483423 RepID=A0A0H5DQV5_9BACT|nr:Hsp70 family protein [Estrella lausannensis]CRX37984.1 Chaperone protein DnaK [Estrella lausannensis]
MQKMRYIIGIDLGTTNCTMAYAERESDPIAVKQFAIPQMTAPGVKEELFSLPSFIYFPLEEEEGQLEVVSEEGSRFVIGAYAKSRGEEVPDRLVASSKSWLCQSSVDRRAKNLPFNSKDPSRKASPLEASARLLRHLKEAWDSKMDAPFNEQKILITVPASFDPSARQLVQEAAELAGYPEAVFLEEPQAAFYAWLGAQGDAWRSQLKVGDDILVVDIGGGTTDFSLIKVEDREGALELTRSQVGPHLLLGGDNIDLSLAYLAKDKLEALGHSIDSWQLTALKHAARRAKEELLAEGSKKKSADLSIMGRGSKLIGGSLKAKIEKEEALALILDGFCPIIPSSEKALADKRAGFQEAGLPYVSDPRITAQLSKFLTNGDDITTPAFILFNGGTMKASALQDRILETLANWAREKSKPAPQALPGHDLDHAVSIGAVYYGFSKEGKAVRIKSGLSRSYFIGVEEPMPAVPGRKPPVRALCIAPIGMEEGTETMLEREEFQLAIGEIASFRFFSLDKKTIPQGELATGLWVSKPESTLTELHSIETVLPREEGDSPFVFVKLKVRYTELGVLELFCRSEAGREWKLEFDLRKQEADSLV